jgi:pimeloyl-ACP methyl ester carboxylesterase
MHTLGKIIKIIMLGIAGLALLASILFGHRDKSVAALAALYAPLPSAFLPVAGMEVHYRDEGDPQDSLPIVLIHGTGASLHTFEGWAQALKTRKRVIRMDLPAFGLTGPFPGRDYAMGNYVAFLDDFLRALGVEHCILAGNSLGGAIAWQYTAEKPERVEQLILIDAAGYPSAAKSEPLAFTLARIPVLSKLFTFITPRAAVKASLENVYADQSKVSDELVALYFDLSLRAGNRQAFVDRLNTPYDDSKLPRLKAIQQPTLILWGAEDLLIPVEIAQRFHEDLPRSTLVILEDVGHVPMEESPAASLAPVLAFLGL